MKRTRCRALRSISTAAAVFLLPLLSPNAAAAPELGIFEDARPIGDGAAGCADQPGQWFTRAFNSGYKLGSMGGDIWSTGDTFTFAFSRIRGDFVVSARVVSHSASADWGKVGVMVRQDLTPTSRHNWVHEPIFPQGNSSRQTVWGGRTTHGEATAAFNTYLADRDGLNFPWIRVARHGSVVTGYGSLNGKAWVDLGSTDWGTDAPEELVAGLVVCGNADCSRPAATGSFTDVSIVEGPPEGELPLDLRPRIFVDSTSGVDCDGEPQEWYTEGSEGTYKLEHSGGDTWKDGDSFTFAHSEVKGDFRLTARIVSRVATVPWGKVGLMVRQDDTTHSRHSWIQEPMFPDGELRTTQWGGRTTHGEAGSAFNTHDQFGFDGFQYEWIQIARRGNTVIGFGSPEGEVWHELGSMDWGPDAPDTLLVGLTVCAGSGSTDCDLPTATGVFDQVTLKTDRVPEFAKRDSARGAKPPDQANNPNAATPAPPPAPAIFPDRNLEAAIREYLFSKRGTEARVTAADIKYLSTLDARGENIRDLSGIEKCERLRSIDLSGNEISDAGPLRALEKIQFLDLSGNKLADVEPLRGLAKLQHLALASNHLSDIGPLSELRDLTHLDLSKNEIGDIEPLGRLERLASLYLAQNQIVSVEPLKKLTSLSTLDLGTNRVSDLSPLANQTGLRRLLLGENEITDISVLLDMATKDHENERRFAPYWHVRLTGNRISAERIAALKKLVRRVDFATVREL